jgi:hypothetical protein
MNLSKYGKPNYVENRDYFAAQAKKRRRRTINIEQCKDCEGKFNELNIKYEDLLTRVENIQVGPFINPSMEPVSSDRVLHQGMMPSSFPLAELVP